MGPARSHDKSGAKKSPEELLEELDRRIAGEPDKPAPLAAQPQAPSGILTPEELEALLSDDVDE